MKPLIFTILILLFSANEICSKVADDKEFDDIYATVSKFCISEYNNEEIIFLSEEYLLRLRDTLIFFSEERQTHSEKVLGKPNPAAIEIGYDPLILISNFKIINAELKGSKATVKVEYDLVGELIEVKAEFEVDGQFEPYSLLKFKSRVGEKEIVYLNLEKKEAVWLIIHRKTFAITQKTRYGWWVIDPPTPHISVKAVMDAYKPHAKLNAEVLDRYERGEVGRVIGKEQKRNLLNDISIYEILKKLVESDSCSAEPVFGLFPEASMRVLSDEELGDKSEKELWLMRNEIFARKGYVFKNDELKEHFLSQGWYIPRYDNVDSLLTSIERKNIETIIIEEKRRK